MNYKVGALLFAVLVFSLTANAQNKYEADINEWRAKYEERLVSNDGWLTVAGLSWLKDGENTVGVGKGFDIQLTENFKNNKFGTIKHEKGITTLKLAHGVNAVSSGKEFSQIDLQSDTSGKPTVIQTGTQSFYLIEREGRLGVRVKDTNSRFRQSYSGLDWFPVDQRYLVKAKYERFVEPQNVAVPNVLGTTFTMKSPGILKFIIDGISYELQPVIEGDSKKFFIIFRDETARTSTYGGGRFLYADIPETGDEVILDFNKAYNPPCAYTPFATCPLPPPHNRLTIELPVGEKRYASLKDSAKK